jgi:hypothetical protein
MNKKVIVFLFVFLLLVFEIKWSKITEPFKETQDPIPFRMIDNWENWYIKQTHISFNKPLNENVCAENLLLFNEIMTLHGIPFWLSEGTALGVVRDNSFISYDDDVDVSFMYPHREKFVKEVLPVLKSYGFRVGTSFHYGNFIGLHRKGEKLDVDIVQEGGLCMSTRSVHNNLNVDCNDLLPYLKNMQQVEFLGTIFTVPGEDYLEHLYSSTWKTPKKTKFKNKI